MRPPRQLRDLPGLPCATGARFRAEHAPCLLQLELDRAHDHVIAIDASWCVPADGSTVNSTRIGTVLAAAPTSSPSHRSRAVPVIQTPSFVGCGTRIGTQDAARLSSCAASSRRRETRPAFPARAHPVELVVAIRAEWRRQRILADDAIPAHERHAVPDREDRARGQLEWIANVLVHRLDERRHAAAARGSQLLWCGTAGAQVPHARQVRDHEAAEHEHDRGMLQPAQACAAAGAPAARHCPDDERQRDAA